MLTIELNTENKIQQIILIGELSGLQALEFRQNIESIIEEHTEQIILDMRNVKALDLTGFNAVVMLKVIAEKRSKSFSILIVDSGPLTEYLHMSKLNLNHSIASS